MDRSRLHLYTLLSRLGRPKTYKGKIMLVAFIGTHVPLLVLLLYALITKSYSMASTMRLLLVALVATLIGTAATLYAFHLLLAPVSLTSQALRSYLDRKILSSLPTHYRDEAGTLMANTTRTLRSLDEAIEYMTNYDNVTGLPNRDLFQLRLQQAIAKTQQHNQQLALIALDLDNLKQINSTLGRKVGDLLLRSVAQRLSACLQKTDIIARLGGDDFGILRTELTTSDNLNLLSQDLLAVLAKPFSLFGKEVYASACVGITLYPFDGATAEQLLQNADVAVHQARQQEHYSYQFYSEQMNERLQRRLALEEQMRYALRRGELFLHYQPRIDLESNCPLAAEALLRWQNPQLGMVSPAEFIPIAEENGLIIPIGEWVLRSACMQNRNWQRAGLPPLRVSVNLSALQFKQENLLDTIDRVLEETGLDPAYLELEVTESLLVENVEQAIVTLQQLKDRGIALALDDFGTGYSSLNYLQKFPIDTLKIDRSFVEGVASNPDDAAIAKGIIALARSLQLNITAEGVETLEQLNYIKVHGCHEAQGYYFSKPMSAYSLVDFLASYSR